ncbi:MAG: hypothetical protein WC455_15435 [Dehalococcoidia bacterium]|jgi:hypothetical protein
MGAKINYEAKNDHELLIMIAQQLDFVTENCEKFRTDGECSSNGLSKKAKTTVATALIAGVVSLGLGIVEIFKR